LRRFGGVPQIVQNGPQDVEAGLPFRFPDAFPDLFQQLFGNGRLLRADGFALAGQGDKLRPGVLRIGLPAAVPTFFKRLDQAGDGILLSADGFRQFAHLDGAPSEQRVQDSPVSGQQIRDAAFREGTDKKPVGLFADGGDQGDDGVTPKLEVRDDGYWYISYDNGQTWNKLGPATGDPGEDGDSMFSDIDVSDPDYLVLTLAETGASIKLPYYKDKFDLLFVSGSDRVKEMSVYCGPGATAEVEYELTNPLNVQVAIECISHSGYEVAVDKSAKKITVSAPDDPAAITDPESEILVFASDDERTVMRKLVVKQVKYIDYRATRQLDWEKSSVNPRFWGEDCKFLDEQSTYDSATGEGRWAYTGTVIYITDAAFSGEAGLQEIVIPASVVEVGRNLWNETGGGGAFQNCTALTSVVFEGDNLSKINLNTFNGCSALSSIELPESLEKIEYNAFDDCSALKSIVIPDKVTYIGEGAFNYCTGLQEAYIGDGVTEIAAKAFAECTALKTVVIGKSIQRIGDQAFNTRSSWDQMTLEKITVLFDDIASGSFPVLESGSRGVFPKPGGWDLVSYKIYVPKGTKAEYQKNWSDYSSLIVEMQ